MRSAPTMSYSNVTIDDDVASYSGSRINGTNDLIIGTDRADIHWDVGSFTSAGRSFRVITSAAGGYIQGDAEL